MKKQTIHHVFDTLQEATTAYYQAANRLNKWGEKYPNYDFAIDIISYGIKRNPTVRIIIVRDAKKVSPEEVKGDSR